MRSSARRLVLVALAGALALAFGQGCISYGDGLEGDRASQPDIYNGFDLESPDMRPIGPKPIPVTSPGLKGALGDKRAIPAGAWEQVVIPPPR